MPIILAKKIELYVAENGRQPFVDWFEALKDPLTKTRVRIRMNRLACGHYGDYKPVGHGVFELRLQFGAGYRIYFGEIGQAAVLLLCAGDKKTQKRDIKRAQYYWVDYLTRVYQNEHEH